MGVAAAILAAGAGSRVGGEVPKPLLLLDGATLVFRALAAPRAAGLAPVLLVVGRDGDRVAAAAPPDVEVVWSPRWQDGISQSLHAAIEHLGLRQDVDAVCIGLADQPRVGAEAYRRLAGAHSRGAALAVATYGGARRNPVLIGRSLWPEAARLEGDAGARVLFARYGVVEVDCSDTGDPVDVDTLADLRALGEHLGAG